MVSLFSHTGLGDEILLSGAIVELLKRHGRVRTYCDEKYLSSVRSFYTHYPEVLVTGIKPVGGDRGVPPEFQLRPVEEKVIRTGFYAGEGTRSDISFPEAFYRQLFVDYGERWKSCPIEKAAEAVPQLDTHLEVFVHDDAARGYHIVKGITAKPVFRPLENGGSILSFVRILRKAKEIHCIDSAFYHLVESLEGISAKLYYHRYAKYYIPGWCDYPKRYAWQILP